MPLNFILKGQESEEKKEEGEKEEERREVITQAQDFESEYPVSESE